MADERPVKENVSGNAPNGGQNSLVFDAFSAQFFNQFIT
jgi:hypothetical protein